MKSYIFVVLIPLIFIGCNDRSSEEQPYTYFGGEVIKPNNNYVTFNSFRSGKDTIYLDENNRFLHKIENIRPGLFTFTHGGEFQTIIIEENDSLLFRLNTDDFDESLVYTGRGAKKNNFLIKSYLNDEVENEKFARHHQLEPEEFEAHINEKRSNKLEELDRFLSKAPQSDLFKAIAKAGINYNFYAYREMYPFGHYGNNKLIHFKDLPEDFYEFRSEVDYNDESLTELPSYNRYLFWHFNNIALNKFYQDGKHNRFDRQALDYNLEKLHLIDQNIKSETIKNYLLKFATREFIRNGDNPVTSVKMLNAFLNLSTNQEDKTYITALHENLERLKPGNPMPNSKIYNYNRDKQDLISIINKPTVIFCWLSNNKMHYRNSHYMAKSLQARFPEIDFVAINATDNDLEFWKRTVSRLDYPKEHEYIFESSEKAIDTYVITYGHRVFILDKNGIIVNSNANLFGDEIQDQLEALLTKSVK